jgi:hypothetical protein
MKRLHEYSEMAGHGAKACKPQKQTLYTVNECILPLVFSIRHHFLWKNHSPIVDYVPAGDFAAGFIKFSIQRNEFEVNFLQRAIICLDELSHHSCEGE